MLEAMSRMVKLLKSYTPVPLKKIYWRARLRARKAKRVLSPVTTCQVRGFAIKIGVSSEVEHYRADSYSTKEPETLDWLEQNLQDHDVFMDVGANIGLYSIYAAKFRPRCQIYAFEPEGQNYSRLCLNLYLNNAANVIPCNFALSDRQTFDLFYVGALAPGSALHSLSLPSKFGGGNGASLLRQSVISTTIDALVGEYGIPTPSLLKIDVDGIEDRILNGAQGTLNSVNLRTILVEVTYNPETEIPWAEQKLKPFGYTLIRRSIWVANLNGLRSQNYIFNRH